jgi:hypothetical protein
MGGSGSSHGQGKRCDHSAPTGYQPGQQRNLSWHRLISSQRRSLMRISRISDPDLAPICDHENNDFCKDGQNKERLQVAF